MSHYGLPVRARSCAITNFSLELRIWRRSGRSRTQNDQMFHELRADKRPLVNDCGGSSLALLVAHMSRSTLTERTEEATTESASEPSFLNPHPKIPVAIRDLLVEADGCIRSGFLIGGAACARRAVEMLLTATKADGETYEARLEWVHKTHAVPQMLTMIVAQCGNPNVRDARLGQKTLELFVAAIKAVLYELYVLGPDRTERLQHIRRLVSQVERPTAPTDLVVDVAGA